MIAVILCGGLGTRLDSEGVSKPKSLVKIDKETILDHLIKILAFYSIDEIILCTGYKYYMFEDHFRKKRNFKKLSKKKNIMSFSSIYLKKKIKINLFFTGINTGTGGRLKKAIKKFQIKDDFLFTYGDGLSDIDLNNLKKFYLETKKLAVVTAVNPPSRYGKLSIRKDKSVTSFNNEDRTSKINGGFFVLSPRVIKFINKSSDYWEDAPMQNLIKKKQLSAYVHNGFWKSLDTLKDKKSFENIIKRKKKAPWIKW